MFLMKSKVARELLNDFELTSFHIQFFSLSKVYIFRVSVDRHLISILYETRRNSKYPRNKTSIQYNIDIDICILDIHF